MTVTPMRMASAAPQSKTDSKNDGMFAWHLREFRVADLDGNQLRVFYDFGWELSKDPAWARSPPDFVRLGKSLPVIDQEISLSGLTSKT